MAYLGIDELTLPIWAKGSQFYFTNGEGEVLIAKITGETLIIGSNNTNSEPYIFTADSLFSEMERLATTHRKFWGDRFCGIKFGIIELNWLVSVVPIFFDSLVSKEMRF